MTQRIPILAFAVALSLFTSAGGAQELVVEHGKPGFVLDNGSARVFVTQTGGHMTASFPAGKDRPRIEPYHVSPWQDEPGKVEPPILGVLRGDFFCLPFGGNAEAFHNEQHPPHGETANSAWSLVSNDEQAGKSRLVLTLETQARPGRVTKELTIVETESVIYSKHTIEGFAGPAPLGHHATLAMPKTEGALRVSTSKFTHGLTNPTQFSNPANGEYQSLAINAKFDDLAKVPQIFKDAPDADCTKFPARQGYADLLCVLNQSNVAGEPAWVAAVNTEAKYLWFALKDPAVLPSLLFWVENRGRHGAPWNGRNNCLGLEDVCTFFADGVAPSARENTFTKLGVPTTIELRSDKPTEIRYIQGAVPVPEGFGKVEHIEFAPGSAKFVDGAGHEVKVSVRHDFLKSGRL
ncbi:MAG: hypothetical protein C0483_08900 [Pirellula sp.]|nr:hypothetical protein [Pirellula sp.]